MIIGVNTLTGHGMSISFESDPTLTAYRKSFPFRSKSSVIPKHTISSSSPLFPKLDDNVPIEDKSLLNNFFKWSGCAGDSAAIKHLQRLLLSMRSVIAVDDNDVGKTDEIHHTITLTDNRPIRHNARRLSPDKAKLTRKLVDDMLEQDIIEPSSSPWASPIVLAKKDGGGTRFCVDYRNLNNVTRKDAFPLPRIDDTLDALHGAKYFSTLDLQSGYWQVLVAPEDREKTAFVTPHGLYQFRRMPFGLTNTPATFQRLMYTVLKGLLYVKCLIYLDDIIIFGRTREEHAENLLAVLKALESAGLKIKPRKCNLLRTDVSFLGHCISEKGVTPSAKKVNQVSEWPIPKTIKHVQGFVGFAKYYRRFIRNFARVATPLTKLSRKGQVFQWGKEQLDAFMKLRSELATTPGLPYPNWNRPFILDTDASNSGLGAVLSQLDDDGVERPIAFASRSLSDPERNYSTTRQELLAVVWATEHFRVYLLHAQFQIRCDHQALKWLRTFKNPRGPVARWIEHLSEYDYAWIHRPGAQHGNADGLSRYPVDDAPPTINSLHFLGSDEACREWQEATDNDQDLKEIKNLLQSDTRNKQPTRAGARALWTEKGKLFVDNGLVYRRLQINASQLIVPRTFRSRIIREAHSIAVTGHFATRRTIALVAKKYFWIGFRAEIDEFCRRCTDCQRSKAKNPVDRAPLQHFASSKPLELVAMDLMGPLPISSSKNAYILVVVDHFSKWTECYPLPDIRACTVALCFVKEFVSRHGLPERIHTDQGKQFESLLFRELCLRLDIDKSRTTPYHPQGDGVVERANRTIQNILKIFVDEAKFKLGRATSFDDVSVQYECSRVYEFYAVFFNVWSRGTHASRYFVSSACRLTS